MKILYLFVLSIIYSLGLVSIISTLNPLNKEGLGGITYVAFFPILLVLLSVVSFIIRNKLSKNHLILGGIGGVLFLILTSYDLFFSGGGN